MKAFRPGVRPHIGQSAGFEAVAPASVGGGSGSGTWGTDADRTGTLARRRREDDEDDENNVEEVALPVDLIEEARRLVAQDFTFQAAQLR